MSENTVDLLAATEAAEPETTRDEIVVQVLPIKDVRLGDTVEEQVVANKTTGPKWTVLENAEGKRITRLENDVEVSAIRTEKTQEFLQSNRRYLKNEQIRETLSGLGSATQVALEKVTVDIDFNGYADYGSISALLAAQAGDRVLSQVSLMAQHAKAGQDLLDIYEMAVERFKDILASDYRNRALSRSTSVVSNLLEDCEKEAMAEFINRAQWLTY